MLCTWQMHQVHSPLAITKLMEDGQAASMKSQRTGLICCLTGSSCFMEEIHKDMGRSLACFFTLYYQYVLPLLPMEPMEPQKPKSLLKKY